MQPLSINCLIPFQISIFLFFASIEQFCDLEISHLRRQYDRLKHTRNEQCKIVEIPTTLMENCYSIMRSGRHDKRAATMTLHHEAKDVGQPIVLTMKRGKVESGYSTTCQNNIVSTSNRTHDKSHIKCFNRGKTGHYSSECQNMKDDDKANLTHAIDEELALMLTMSKEETHTEEDNVLLN